MKRLALIIAACAALSMGADDCAKGSSHGPHTGQLHGSEDSHHHPTAHKLDAIDDKVRFLTRRVKVLEGQLRVLKLDVAKMKPAERTK